MKRIAIYCPYPYSEAPSQRFRFEQYIPIWEKHGYQVDIYPFLSKDTWRGIYQQKGILAKVKIMTRAWLGRWQNLKKAKDADYVFIHRELAQFGPPLFEWILAKIYNKPFIYDFDDAIWLPNYSESNKRFHWIKWYGKVKHIIKWADQVVVGNEFLRDYAFKYNSNVTIIPTTIDLDNHHTIQTNYKKKIPVIGWTGTHTTLYYLNSLIPVIQRLESEYEFEFQVISNQAPEFNLKSLRFVPWNKETEIKDLAGFSIGVMPLIEDEWANGKCGFKALQYMALGIPSVISPVGVNTKIVQNEINGFLASNPDEFYMYLKRLLDDMELRETVGKRGNKTVQELYSVCSNQSKYLQLFSK